MIIIELSINFDCICNVNTQIADTHISSCTYIFQSNNNKYNVSSPYRYRCIKSHGMWSEFIHSSTAHSCCSRTYSDSVHVSNVNKKKIQLISNFCFWKIVRIQPKWKCINSSIQSSLTLLQKNVEHLSVNFTRTNKSVHRHKYVALRVKKKKDQISDVKDWKR